VLVNEREVTNAVEERIRRKIIHPFLMQHRCDDGKLHRTGLKYGDVKIIINGKETEVECKGEVDGTYNFPWETYHDFNTGWPGWTVTCEADLIVYATEDLRWLVEFELNEARKLLTQELFDMYGWREVPQKKHKQHNLTMLRLVPMRFMKRKLQSFKDYSDMRNGQLRIF